MFENLQDRLAGTLLMGLDVAVEFATLGEFRLVEPELAPAPTARRSRVIALEDVDRSLLPKPSTALARATVPAGTAVASASEAPAAAPRCERRRREAAIAPSAKRAPVRVRGGAVQGPVQLCLAVD